MWCSSIAPSAWLAQGREPDDSRAATFLRLSELTRWQRGHQATGTAPTSARRALVERDMAVDAVVFDLDGVLIDSEPVWSEVRHAFSLAHGGYWAAGADEAMMGMSTTEWARYLHDKLHLPLSVDEIAEGVVDTMITRYQGRLPLFPGAVDTVRRLARRWSLGLASSSPRRLIATVLDTSGLAASFGVVMSTEEVGRGSRSPTSTLP